MPSLLTTALALPVLALGSAEPVRSDQWSSCLFNKRPVDCRRTFLCPGVPCDVFRLDWMLRGFAGAFGLRNPANGNAIVYGMTLPECEHSMLDDFCSR